VLYRIRGKFRRFEGIYLLHFQNNKLNSYGCFSDWDEEICRMYRTDAKTVDAVREDATDFSLNHTLT
jgi:hypothetical protein